MADIIEQGYPEILDTQDVMPPTTTAPLLPLVPLPRPLGSFSTSGPMMRAEMVTRAKAILGETEGMDGDGSPFEWNSLLSQAADDLCRGVHCYYKRFGLVLTAGQADYCPPPIYRLAGVYLRNPATGGVIQLTEAGKQDLYGRGGGYPYIYPGYYYGAGDLRQPLPSAVPLVFLWGGLSDITVSPAPDAATAGVYELAMEGWATTEGLWDKDTDECPLHPRLHPTVIDGAVLLRAAQYPGKANLALIGARYTAARGKAEREAQTFARRQIGGYW